MNLQEGGSSGETNLWYALMIADAASLGHILTYSTSGLSHRVLPIQLTHHGEKLLVQILEICVGGCRAGRDDDVDATLQIRGRGAEDLTQLPPNSVTLHGYANLFGDGQAQPCPTHTIRQGVDGEQPSPTHQTLTVDLLEFERGGETGALAPGQRSDG